jgi:hypothetical protein
MASIGFVTLAETLLNQAAELQAVAPSSAAAATSTTAASGDEFSPSVQNLEQAAGLYTATSSPLVNSDATLLNLAPSASGPTTPNASGALQKLNNALEALDLSNAVINKIDAIATVTNNYNPTSYTVTAHDLEAGEIPQQAQSPAAPAAQGTTARA